MADEVSARGWSTRAVAAVVPVMLLLGGLAGFGFREVWLQHQDRETQRVTARGIVDAIMLRYHWEKWETDPEKRPFLDGLGKNLENQQYRWDFIKPNSSGKGQPQDEFEHAALETFQKPDAPRGANVLWMDRIVTQSDGQRFYEYLQPVYVKTNCTHCHNTLIGPLGVQETGGMSEGGLMAIVKVILPASK